MTPDYDRMSFGELRTYILNNRHDLAALRHLFWVKGRRATPSYTLADTPAEQHRQEQAIRQTSFQQLLTQAQRDRTAGHLTAATATAQTALDLAQKWQDPQAIDTALALLIDLALDQNQLDRAEHLITEAHQATIALNDPHQTAALEFRLAQLWQKRGNLPQAETHRDRSRAIYQQLGAAKDLERIETEWQKAE